MKKHPIVRGLLSLFLCLMLSGCSFTLKTVDNLMHPPRLSGENAGMQEAFEKAVNEKNAIMKSPTTGDYRSAYVLYDFDNDEEEEAVTFYCSSTDDTVVYMHVFDKNDAGEWKSVADIKGSGSEVYKIDFCDMNNDGIAEIVVCWSLYESSGNKLMTVYEPDLSSGTFALRSIITETFSQTVICDMDSDGKDEILNIIIDTTSAVSRTYGRLFKMNTNSTISLVSVVELTPAVSISSLKFVINEADENDRELPKIFLDSVINDAEIITDVIVWDNSIQALRSLLAGENAAQNPPTARSTKLASNDIDKDGVIEIPVTKALPGAITKSGEEDEALPLTVWLSIESGTLVEKTECLMIYSSSYLFKFDAKWYGNVTVVNDISERACIFYKYSSATKKSGEELFRIITVPSVDWQHKPKEDYIVITESVSLTYACQITAAGAAMRITEDYIAAHLSVI